MGHDMGAGHPESPQRLGSIQAHLQAAAQAEASTAVSTSALSTTPFSLVWREAGPAQAEQLAGAHDLSHVQRTLALLGEVARSGQPRFLDADTQANAGTLAAAVHAAGAAIAATDAVMAGEVQRAFCAVRPPGHHATRSQAMGFCFFNNVCVAARHALRVHGLERVAIVDWDVHHGNGTEDIVAGDPGILMVGLFQHPLYPGSGLMPMADNVRNVPLDPYTSGAEVRQMVQREWLPALEAFAPQMLFISAGFDAHREDTLGQLGLVEADYAWITRELVAVAQRHAQGRIVSCLEGGYHLGALGRSVAAHVRALA